jgi:hypothetical protein
MRLTGMIEAFRKDLDAADVPFVDGELGQFLSETKYPFAKLVNEQLHAATAQVGNAKWVSSKDLTAKSDGVHFDAASARELGKRYAKAMRELQAKAAKP